MKNHIYISIILLLLGYNSRSETKGDFSFKGQISAWSILNTSTPIKSYTGLRYLPELKANLALNNNWKIEAEASANINGSMYFKDSSTYNHNLKPYRAWLKLSSNQFEIRAGLQKINFGSAQMLRPLMWFDKIDPRDPLQITDGVYGILGRYYFLNNANIWGWALYGNEDTKGWETLSNAENKPEFGGRVQLPISIGEIAATYHHRTAYNMMSGMEHLSSISPIELNENRYALDTKVNIGIGLWGEVSLTHQEEGTFAIPYQKAFTIGADYTFNVGNGLFVSTEVFSYGISNDLFDKGTGFTFGALQTNYSFSIFSSISAITFYDFKQQQVYNFLNFNYTLDRWSFYLMGFYNDAAFNLYGTANESEVFAGGGMQLMVVFNH